MKVILILNYRGFIIRQYGSKYATEFTKKQISVIYYKAKSEELRVEKWFILELYALADYFGYDDNKNIANEEKEVLDILKEVFDNNLDKAQKLIDETSNKWYNLYSNKIKSKINRNLFI